MAKTAFMVALVTRPDPGAQHVADIHHLGKMPAAPRLDGTEDDQLDHGVASPDRIEPSRKSRWRPGDIFLP